MPAGGAAPRKVFSLAETSEVALGASEDGVCWLDRSEERAGRSPLYSLRPGDTLVTVDRGYDGASLPWRFGGRIYWVPYKPARDPHAEAGREAAQIVSANPDGSDRRIVTPLEHDDHGQGEIESLRPHEGKLYALVHVVATRETRGGPPLGTVETEVCRVHPGRVQPLESLFRVPSGATLFFVGKYAYYTGWENRDKWYDWSSAGMGLKNVRVLYRRPLPD
jgi:hypothetical protein